MSQIAMTLMNLQPQVGTAALGAASTKASTASLNQSGQSEFQVLQTLMALKSGEMKSSELPQGWIEGNSDLIAKVASDPEMAKALLQVSEASSSQEGIVPTSQDSSFQASSNFDGTVEGKSEPKKNPFAAIFDRPAGNESAAKLVESKGAQPVSTPEIHPDDIAFLKSGRSFDAIVPKEIPQNQLNESAKLNKVMTQPLMADLSPEQKIKMASQMSAPKTNQVKSYQNLNQEFNSSLIPGPAQGPMTPVTPKNFSESTSDQLGQQAGQQMGQPLSGEQVSLQDLMLGIDSSQPKQFRVEDPAMMGKAPDSVQVLDINHIEGKNRAQIMDAVVDHLRNEKFLNSDSIDVVVRHGELGDFNIQASKVGKSNMVQLELTTFSQDGKNFFELNESELLKSLNQNGVKISDFKLVNKLPMEMSLSSTNNTQNQSGQSFDGSSQNNGQGQRQFAGQQQPGQDSGHNKRQALWKQYQEQMYGAS